MAEKKRKSQAERAVSAAKSKASAKKTKSAATSGRPTDGRNGLVLFFGSLYHSHTLISTLFPQKMNAFSPFS